MFRLGDLALAERRLEESIEHVQSALAGADWVREGSSSGALVEYDSNWLQRKVVFKSAMRTVVEVQLWKSKKDGHCDVDIMITAKR